MTTNDRCPNCDRPRATALELDAIRLGAPRADGLCYDSAAYRMCEGRRVDWHARALVAERERDALRAAIVSVEAAARSLDDGPWPPPVVAPQEWATMSPAEKITRDSIGTWRSLAEKRRDELERERSMHADEQSKLVDEVMTLRAERAEARRLLAAAACGKLRRCETCGERIATRRWRGTDVDVCDRCFDEDKRDADDAWETLDEEACEDLPHAVALRAALTTRESGR